MPGGIIVHRGGFSTPRYGADLVIFRAGHRCGSLGRRAGMQALTAFFWPHAPSLSLYVDNTVPKNVHTPMERAFDQHFARFAGNVSYAY